ncbi:MAG TPA: ABC transporter permease [bacterium]|nr:ABC transporter permease [bacterium]
MVTPTLPAPTATRDGLAPRQSSQFADTWRALRRDPSGRAGMALLVFFLLLACLGPAASPQNPLTQDIAARLQPPSRAHWLGTDELGRDVTSRIAHGAHLSLGVGVISVLLAMVVGGMVGLVSGTQRGLVDRVLMRVMDTMMAFPTTLLAIAVVSLRGPGLMNTLLAIGVIRVPIFARLTRSTALSIREIEYVAAAHAMGARAPRIMLRHILPNSISPLIVQATLGVGSAIVEAAGLGFLGLGQQPPYPEWGEMLGSSYVYLIRAPWAMFAPGVAIILAVLAFNLFGDALRDAIDPRIRRHA